MHHRFLRSLVLLLSLALAALPVQQAFASPLDDITWMAGNSHCMEMAGSHQAMNMSADAKGEPMQCCDQQCKTDCASHYVTAAILLATASIRFHASASAYEVTQIPLLSRTTSPALPPPLS